MTSIASFLGKMAHAAWARTLARRETAWALWPVRLPCLASKVRTSSHSIAARFILILSFHLQLDHPSVSVPKFPALFLPDVTDADCCSELNGLIHRSSRLYFASRRAKQQCWNISTCTHPVPILRISGAIPPMSCKLCLVTHIAVMRPVAAPQQLTLSLMTKLLMFCRLHILF